MLGLFVLAAGLVSPAWLRTSRPRHPVSDALAGFPQVIVWAWERPENLTFVDPAAVGVGVLVGTVVLGDGGLTVRPRRQPVRYPRGATVLAVVRIETGSSDALKLTPEVRREAVRQTVALATSSKVAGIQIDFDAALSERRFYEEFLRDLREHLPSALKLSITALASWCLDDAWIAGLPVDEAVPMLFRLGAGREEVWHRLEGGRDFRVESCRHSVGVSTDELPAALPAGRRVYLFHPASWSEESLTRALRGTRDRQ